MRTIEEIKREMEAAFMANATLQEAYGFEDGASFSSTFSKVSIENLLLYICAVGIYVLEALFQEHKKDVDSTIAEMLPHRPKWYRDKALQYMDGHTLIPDTDQYDTSGMTDEDIEAARVVKYAAATENPDASLLTIKVAGVNVNGLCPLEDEQASRLVAYIREVKDAGVRIALVNQEADLFRCEVNVYYDPVLAGGSVRTSCCTAIKNYIQGLPFNGEYTNMGLIDALQEVDGVRVAELTSSGVLVNGLQAETAINARYTPAAGYLNATDEDLTINMIPYDEQV